MAKDGKDWKKILKAIGCGIAVAFISWILAINDNVIIQNAWSLGILVAYLEYRFAK